MKRQVPSGFSKAVQIGKGAFGTVLRARQDDLGRWVALKEIASGDKATRDEAQALAASPLPCLPTVFGLVSGRRGDWICMEYVHGISLRDFLAQGADVPHASALAAQLVRSVAMLHGAGRAHGDLKPENAIVEPDGRIRLVDLGLSDAIPESVQGGSVGYLAPERGLAGCDARRADLWALGVCLHETLVGSRPSRTEASTGWKRLRLACVEWVPLVDMLLREDPARRPATANAIIPELPEVAPLAPESLERIREQADRNLAGCMVDEAALLLRDGSPSEALWLLQQALELDPDQSGAMGLLPRVRLDAKRPPRRRWIAWGGLAFVSAALAVAFALHREHRRPPANKIVYVRETGTGDRVRLQQAPRRNESLPLREGRGDK